MLTNWPTTVTTQSTLSYDNNGNLITDGTYTYSWNARNQLQTVSNTTGGTVLANYSYDASGRRTSKAILSVSGTTTTTTGYAYDGANFVQELNKAGTNTSPNTTNDIRATLITAGVDEALARMTGSGAAAQVLSLATDGNNNTLHTSDQAQTQNTAYTYEAYGRATSTNSTDSNSQQYTGRELDIKSAATNPTNNNPLNSGGLMYYRARYYLPGCARFISEDPIGWASGQTNSYAYVGGSPTNFTDPSGEFLNVVIGGLVGGFSAYMGAASNPCASGAQIAGATALGALTGTITTLVPVGGYIVAAAIQNGLAGAAGNLVGQALTNDNINWNQVVAQGVVGAGAGMAGNLTAMSLPLGMIYEGNLATGTLAGIAAGLGLNALMPAQNGGLMGTSVQASSGGGGCH
jgi:RHS repeat-associated protein